jgi:hypothetical protein
MDDDLFYCVRHWRTVHYSKLEAFLHDHLKACRKKNEFFETDISRIEEGVELFAKTNGPQFFNEDVVLINAEIHNVAYIHSKGAFFFADSVRYVSDVDMRAVILEWLAIPDIYNLVKFMSMDVVDKLVGVLKHRDQAASELASELASSFQVLTISV